MSSSLIGSGSEQEHILGGPKTLGTGYGGAPSLPQHLRHFDGAAGVPARAGEMLPGGPAVPLTQAEALLLNRHFHLYPAGPVPGNEAAVGAWLANADAIRNRTLWNWLTTDAARARILHSLRMGFDGSLGVGLTDIADAFGNPGHQNERMIRVLNRWAEIHPAVRAHLDGFVATLRDEGVLPPQERKP